VSEDDDIVVVYASGRILAILFRTVLQLRQLSYIVATPSRRTHSAYSERLAPIKSSSVMTLPTLFQNAPQISLASLLTHVFIDLRSLCRFITAHWPSVGSGFQTVGDGPDAGMPLWVGHRHRCRENTNSQVTIVAVTVAIKKTTAVEEY